MVYGYEVIMMRDELRNLLKSQDLNTVNPSAFKQVGGVVFPDQAAAFSLADFGSIVDAFRAVHLPAYGSAIPQSAKNASVTNDGDLLAVTGNTVAVVQAVQISTTGTDPATCALNLNGVLVANANADPAATQPVVLPYPLIVDSAGSLSVSGSSADLTLVCTYYTISQ